MARAEAGCEFLRSGLFRWPRRDVRRCWELSIETRGICLFW